MTIEQARGKIEIGTPVRVKTRVPVGAQACITPEDKGRVLRLVVDWAEVEFQTRREGTSLEYGLEPGVYMLFVSNLETLTEGGCEMTDNYGSDHIKVMVERYGKLMDLLKQTRRERDEAIEMLLELGSGATAPADNGADNDDWEGIADQAIRERDEARRELRQAKAQKLQAVKVLVGADECCGECQDVSENENQRRAGGDDE